MALTSWPRWLRNIVLLPPRIHKSLRHRLRKVYGLQWRANRLVRKELSAESRTALSAVPGTTSDRDCRLLYYLARISPLGTALVEIGAFKGKSTAWLAEAARRDGRAMTSIDPQLKDSQEEFARTVRQFRIDEVAVIHKAFSHEIGKDWSGPIGLLWVDGGHDCETVRQDIQDFTPHLAAGGIAVFDDANERRFPGVLRALAETLRRDRAFQCLGDLRGLAIFKRIRS